jgi:hypothetical protein
MSDWITAPGDVMLVIGMTAFIALVFGVIIGFIVNEKGYSPLLGFALGLFLGPIGLFVALALRDRTGASGTDSI